MSRPDLIKNIKNAYPKLNIIQIEIIIDTFFESIVLALSEKKAVSLRGFGTFFVREIKEKYSARNPKTGELIYVPKKFKARFKPSKKLNNFINQ